MTGTLSRLFKDSFHVVVTQGVTYFTAAVWGVLLIRWVGPGTFGSYIYYTSLFSIIITILQFGTIAYLSKELNVRDNSIESFYVHSSLQISISVVLFALTMGNLFFTNFDQTTLFIYISSFLITSGDNISNVLTTYNFSKNDAKFVANTSLFRGALLIAVGFFCFFIKTPSHFIIAIPAVISWLRVGLYLHRLKHKFGLTIEKILRFNLRFGRVINVYRESWVFGSLTILTTIAAYGDPLVLKYLGFKDYDFGIIAAASRLRGLVSLTGGAILNVIFPRLAKDYSKSPLRFSYLFISIFKPIFIVNLIMCSFLIIFSDTLITLMFGVKFQEAIPFMFLFSIGTLTPVLTLLSSAVIATGMEKRILISNLIINGLNPLLKLVFIPFTGTIFIGWYEAILPWISIVIFFLMLRDKIILSNKSFYLAILLLSLLFIFIPALLKIYIDVYVFSVCLILVNCFITIYIFKFIKPSFISLALKK